MKRIITYFFPLVLLFFFSACGSGSSGGKDEEPAILPTEMTVTIVGVDDITQPMEAGTVVKFVASFTPSNTTETRVGWVSSNTNIVSVSENGEMVALNNGTAVITAVAIGNPQLTWSVTITVKDGSIPINPGGGSGQNEAE